MHDEDEDEREPTQRTQRIDGVEIDLRHNVKRTNFWLQVIGGGLVAAFLAGIGVPAYIEKVAHTEELGLLKDKMTKLEGRIDRLLDMVERIDSKESK